MTTEAAPKSLRGEGRVYWNVDRVPPGKPWPSGLPDYSGYLFIEGIRFRIEGWRTENDAGRHVRLVATGEPIHQSQWPKR